MLPPSSLLAQVPHARHARLPAAAARPAQRRLQLTPGMKAAGTCTCTVSTNGGRLSRRASQAWARRSFRPPAPSWRRRRARRPRGRPRGFSRATVASQRHLERIQGPQREVERLCERQETCRRPWSKTKRSGSWQSFGRPRSKPARAPGWTQAPPVFPTSSSAPPAQRGTASAIQHAPGCPARRYQSERGPAARAAAAAGAAAVSGAPNSGGGERSDVGGAGAGAAAGPAGLLLQPGLWLLCGGPGQRLCRVQQRALQGAGGC